MKKNEHITDFQEREITDSNKNNLDDRIEPPNVDVTAGSAQFAERLRQNTSTDPTLSGGDVDATWEMSESQGDESVAGSVATPEQNEVDQIGQAMGVSYENNEELRFGEKERDRDKQRWELDPASSEDYRDRLKDQQ